MDARSLQGLIVFLDLMPVGEDIILPLFTKNHCVSRGRPMVAPTDLMIVLNFVCRGGYYPPVVYKISLRFARDAEDDVPYRFGGFLNSIPVGDGFPLPPI